MSRIRTTALLVAALPFLGACADEAPTASEITAGPQFSRTAESHLIPGEALETDIHAFFEAEMAEKNAELEAAGSNMRIDKVELLLAPDGPHHIGTTIYANNRTQQLGYIWVQGDPRRDGRDYLTYLVDESHAAGFTRTSYPARQYLGNQFEASFAPWLALPCGKMELVRVADTGVDPSYYDDSTLLPDGSPTLGLADIVEAGWRLLPAGVLGVTSTWVFVDPATGVPTDINGDGRRDTSRTEIWYALGYYWTTVTNVSGIDLLSVAIHENGHAIGLGHFGMLFTSDANGKLHFAPRAIMNAAYVSRMQTLLGTDESAFCTNYASWE